MDKKREYKCNVCGTIYGPQEGSADCVSCGEPLLYDSGIIVVDGKETTIDAISEKRKVKNSR